MSASDPKSAFYIGHNPDHMYYDDWASSDDNGGRLWPKDNGLRHAVFLVGAACVFSLVALLAGCASDPYPNDRSMAHMSASELTRELTR